MKPKKRKKSVIAWIEDDALNTRHWVIKEGSMPHEYYILPSLYYRYHDERLMKVKITVEEL